MPDQKSTATEPTTFSMMFAILDVSHGIHWIDKLECEIISAIYLCAIDRNDPSKVQRITKLAREISEAGASLGATLANLATMIERRRDQRDAEKGAHHA